ncbi:MAG: Ribosomal RNA small subunit methyltransferase E [Parcubacteria group bacterium GW2011_GWA2_42_14]|nr:MAG: Ribosomal RNA small subunit methyltransferase E [Parcubacteria group bacterium GW2011_GWA2_42_14]
MENEKIVHQLSRVLKIKKGEKIVFFNESGFDFIIRVDKLLGRFVSGKIVEKIKNERDSDVEVHLYQSLIKKNKFEWVLEKGTELGVKFFHPMISERSIKTAFNMERARRIVKEATEQSGQDKFPEIYETIKITTALESARTGTSLLFDPGGEIPVPFQKNIGVIHVFIGPEGGFTERELAIAQKCGVRIFSLGSRILRAETAAIVCVARYLT